MRELLAAIVVGALVGVIIMMVVPPPSAQAQLGNLDDCDVFYRLAKYNVGWDSGAPRDVALATAYSQLCVACMLRNGQVSR